MLDRFLEKNERLFWVAGALVLVICAIGYRSLFYRAFPAVTEAHINADAQRLGLPSGWRCLHSAQYSDPDLSLFYLFEVAPADAPSLRNTIGDHLSDSDPRLRTYSHDVNNRIVSTVAPPWWHPERLPDVEVIHDGHWWFALSAKEGQVYAFRF